MSRHSLQGRDAAELTWHRRRSFIAAAAAWTALGGATSVQAQSRGNIVELTGDALLNGQRLRPDDTIQTGDDIRTGPGSSLVFVVGNSAFRVRQNSRLAVDRGATLNAVSVLRLLSGGVASVWGAGPRRQIVMPTMTAGIRGTGTYAEIVDSQGGRNYLCNCYGTVDVRSGQERVLSQASYHQAFWGEVQPRAGRSLSPARAINHDDEELEALARLVGQRTAWQLQGRKGSRDGRGYVDGQVEQAHPAAPAN